MPPPHRAVANGKNVHFTSWTIKQKMVKMVKIVVCPATVLIKSIDMYINILYIVNVYAIKHLLIN